MLNLCGVRVALQWLFICLTLPTHPPSLLKQVKECPELTKLREQFTTAIAERDDVIGKLSSLVETQNNRINELTTQVDSLSTKLAEAEEGNKGMVVLEQEIQELNSQLSEAREQIRKHNEAALLEDSAKSSKAGAAAAFAIVEGSPEAQAAFNEKVLRAQLIAAQQETENIKLELEAMLQVTDAFKHEGSDLRKALLECRDEYNAKDRQLEEKDREIASLIQALRESRTLFANGQGIRQSPPRGGVAAHHATSGIVGVSGVGISGVSGAGPLPAISTIPAHHGYHAAPECIRYKDLRPGHESYAGPSLRTPYRERAARVTRAHDAWLKAGGNSAAPAHHDAAAQRLAEAQQHARAGPAAPAAGMAVHAPHSTPAASTSSAGAGASAGAGCVGGVSEAAQVLAEVKAANEAAAERRACREEMRHRDRPWRTSASKSPATSRPAAQTATSTVGTVGGGVFVGGYGETNASIGGGGPSVNEPTASAAARRGRSRATSATRGSSSSSRSASRFYTSSSSHASSLLSSSPSRPRHSPAPEPRPAAIPHKVLHRAAPEPLSAEAQAAMEAAKQRAAAHAAAVQKQLAAEQREAAIAAAAAKEARRAQKKSLDTHPPVTARPATATSSSSTTSNNTPSSSSSSSQRPSTARRSTSASRRTSSSSSSSSSLLSARPASKGELEAIVAGLREFIQAARTDPLT